MSEALRRLAANRWIFPVLWGLGLALAFAIPQYQLLNGYTVFVLTTLCINVILCASLNLVNGYMGEFSVGHAGFMALGAYASAVLTTKLLPAAQVAWLFPLVVVAGGALAALIGFFLAVLSFKTRGDYL
ncbi:MAG TPA: hypothetical protein VIS74_02505, partial [Chthoniobacterales bacterium]